MRKTRSYALIAWKGLLVSYFLKYNMRLTQIRRFPERLLSTVQRGTAFEYHALALLTKYMSMSLTRVGGSHDGGVDLIGWWWVPTKDRIATRACVIAYVSRVHSQSYILYQILSTLP